MDAHWLKAGFPKRGWIIITGTIQNANELCWRQTLFCNKVERKRVYRTLVRYLINNNLGKIFPSLLDVHN